MTKIKINISFTKNFNRELNILMNIAEWIAVVNPKAGGGKVSEQWPILAHKLKEQGVSFDEMFTGHRYHAVELVIAALRKGYRKIISVGGDGTIHEIVNGLMHQDDVLVGEVTLAVLPAGSGNDWTRMYKIPLDYDKAIANLISGRTIMQDLAKVTFRQSGVDNTRYMVNIAGVGLDANICYRTNIAKAKGASGPGAYAKASFEALLGRTFTFVKVYVDGKRFFSGRYFSIALGIGKYSGGGMIQVPDAVADDGKIAFMLARKLPKLKFVMLFKKLYTGEIYSIKEVMHTQASEIKIVTDKPDRVEVDGEVVGTTPVTFTVIPRALKVVVGEDY